MNKKYLPIIELFDLVKSSHLSADSILKLNGYTRSEKGSSVIYSREIGREASLSKTHNIKLDKDAK